MESRNLILVGGGGHGLSVADAALSAGFSIRGVIDSNNQCKVSQAGITYLGDLDIIDDMNRDEFVFVITVGQLYSFHEREKIYKRLSDNQLQVATIIASTAYVARSAFVGTGTVILHGAIVNANAKIGRNCTINSGALIEHGVVVGDNVHVSTKATVNGDCTIGSGSFVGSGSVLKQGIVISENCFVQMGSHVTIPVAHGCTWNRRN